MTRFITFALSDGSSFVAEVEDSIAGSGTRRGGPQEGLVEASSKTLELALKSVTHAAETVFDKFYTLARPPEELSLELGIKLTAEAGAVIAKTATEASFKVTMKWKRPSGTGE